MYTRKLKRHETVVCVDEKTYRQPRLRKAATLPAIPHSPIKVEHEYERKGALNLFAAFDTRTGKVWGQTYERKRQQEFIAFLEHLDKEIPAQITQIHVVLDNLKMHKGKQVQAWKACPSPLCLSFSTRALLLDESSGTVVSVFSNANA